MKIRDEHKGTNFQHLELLGVTFHLGLKQTKSVHPLWLLWLNDDGRGSVWKIQKNNSCFFSFIVRTDLPRNLTTLSENTVKSLSTPAQRDRPECDHEKQHFDMFVSRLSRRPFYCWLSIMSAWTEWMNWRTHWQFNCSLLKPSVHTSLRNKDRTRLPIFTPDASNTAAWSVSL